MGAQAHLLSTPREKVEIRWDEMRWGKGRAKKEEVPPKSKTNPKKKHAEVDGRRKA